MAEPEKLFICYKGGGGIKITPRNAAGWRAFGLWMGAFAAVSGLFVLIVTRHISPHGVAYTTASFVVFMLVWAVSMIRWMMKRSEMVDMIELLDLKRELDAQKQRGRR